MHACQWLHDSVNPNPVSCRTTDAIVQRFGITTPKLFNMRCFVLAITELGNVELIGTEFGERSHKDVKAAVPFTNGHREDMARQVSTL